MKLSTKLLRSREWNRALARSEIVAAANKHKTFGKPFSMRTLHRAVFCARQNRAVSSKVFKAAGFRGY